MPTANRWMGNHRWPRLHVRAGEHCSRVEVIADAHLKADAGLTQAELDLVDGYFEGSGEVPPPFVLDAVLWSATWRSASDLSRLREQHTIRQLPDALPAKTESPGTWPPSRNTSHLEPRRFSMSASSTSSTVPLGARPPGTNIGPDGPPDDSPTGEAGGSQLGFVATGVASIVAILLTLACSGPNPKDHGVTVIDATGLVRNEVWRQQATEQFGVVIDQAMAHGVDQLDIVLMGTNSADAGKVATVDLTKIEGNTDAKRTVARARLRARLVELIGQIVSQPVEGNGTDVVAAFRTAADLCRTDQPRSCRIWALSDLEDQRVTTAASPEAAKKAVQSLMPDLKGVPVTVSGLGASGADAATVARVEQVWTDLFDEAGSPSVHIARSI